MLFVTFVLFVPDTYKPGISYLSHLVGYFLGVLFGSLFYFLKIEQFKKAETYEEVIEIEPPQLSESGDKKMSQDGMSNY